MKRKINMIKEMYNINVSINHKEVTISIEVLFEYNSKESCIITYVTDLNELENLFENGNNDILCADNTIIYFYREHGVIEQENECSKITILIPDASDLYNELLEQYESSK